MSDENVQKYKLFISEKNLKELQELTEEKDFAKIVSQSLQLYIAILKYQVDNYKLCMMPVQESGEFDEKRQLIFITETFEVQNEE